MSERTTATFDLPSVQVSRVRCSACASRACEALSELPGVTKVDCDLEASAVHVEFDPDRISEDDLAGETERLGLQLAERVRHVAWRVTGLD